MAIAITLAAVYIYISVLPLPQNVRLIINNKSTKSALLNVYARDG